MKDTLYCIGSVLLSLLLALMSLRYITHVWLLAFVYSFQIHFALAAIAGCLVLLLLKRHWYAYLLLTIAVMLLGHGFIMLREFAATPARANTPPLFRVMSFNIEHENFSNAGRIADFVIASNADVVNILEAAPLRPYIARLSSTYPYHIGCGEEINQCDTLVLSKRPFIEKKVASLGKLWQNRLTYSAIDFDGTKISFLVAHLAKPYFDDFQADELVDLASATVAIDAPLVLTGDFNSAILDPRIQRFMRTSGFHTVFPEPATWPIKARDFGISIDHVLARAPLRLKSVERIEDNMGSNHFGLMAEFALSS
ncbi:endonuclease/exonuclease/phosphatase family protein [Rhizobium sp. BK538]|uniref:endonuclease/exonuclease/phosphatase family protein n=1 Tax=Rhizobium sp. BK538 TaxID=2586984 RepID=UPI00161361E3|nr:endonuclease/exonuclease/phosphatase family protein [Rhizobium sp. BK538]MBB4167862.1 endonuclease/exonuclease/phosphatase (EEP) superfamily protein YafD [Rhizobium sp. BK538]